MSPVAGVCPSNGGPPDGINERNVCAAGSAPPKNEVELAIIIPEYTVPAVTRIEMGTNLMRV